MAFVRTFTFETEAQEQARLAQADPRSKSGMLAPLPVITPDLERGMIIELPQLRHPDSEATSAEDRRVVVALVSFRAGRSPREEGMPVRRDGSWRVMVVASTHAEYPVSGFDLAVGEEELHRGRRIEAAHLLAH